MRGKITSFKFEKGFGFIQGENGEKYFFHISDVLNPMDVEENYSVEFEPKEENNSLSATNIKIILPMVKKDKILKIKDLRIKASDIKEYEIIKYQKDGYFPDEDGKYHCMLVDEPNKYYKYKGFEEFKCEKGSNYIDLYYTEEGFENNFFPLTDIDLIDDLVGLYYLDNYDDYYNHKYDSYYYEYKLIPLTKKSELLNFKVCKRDCYTIKIQTYTSGEKNIHFISHDGEANKKEAYKWLKYIDNEMDSL